MTVDRLIAIARGAVGLGEADAAFRALCGPGETPAMQAALAAKSTCALFLRGCLAYAHLLGDSAITLEQADDWFLGDAPRGLPLTGHHLPPRLWAPYITGRAMGDLITVCERVHLVDMRERLRPGIVLILGTGNNLHALLVERVDRAGWPDGSWTYESIEAGQIDGARRQRVERKRHEIDAAGVDRITHEQDHATQAWEPSSVGPCPRPVAYRLDPSVLLSGS